LAISARALASSGALESAIERRIALSLMMRGRDWSAWPERDSASAPVERVGIILCCAGGVRADGVGAILGSAGAESDGSISTLRKTRSTKKGETVSPSSGCVSSVRMQMSTNVTDCQSWSDLESLQTLQATVLTVDGTPVRAGTFLMVS
jgi:hypothetical protein